MREVGPRAVELLLGGETERPLRAEGEQRGDVAQVRPRRHVGVVRLGVDVVEPRPARKACGPQQREQDEAGGVGTLRSALDKAVARGLVVDVVPDRAAFEPLGGQREVGRRGGGTLELIDVSALGPVALEQGEQPLGATCARTSADSRSTRRAKRRTACVHPSKAPGAQPSASSRERTSGARWDGTPSMARPSARRDSRSRSAAMSSSMSASLALCMANEPSIVSPSSSGTTLYTDTRRRSCMCCSTGWCWCNSSSRTTTTPSPCGAWSSRCVATVAYGARGAESARAGRSGGASPRSRLAKGRGTAASTGCAICRSR